MKETREHVLTSRVKTSTKKVLNEVAERRNLTVSILVSKILDSFAKKNSKK